MAWVKCHIITNDCLILSDVVEEAGRSAAVEAGVAAEVGAEVAAEVNVPEDGLHLPFHTDRVYRR